MFKITDNKGFHVKFPNGWTVSVQFGRGNYGSNYHYRPTDGKRKDVPPSGTAEIAAWDGEGRWHTFENGDEVDGYKTPLQVLQFMNQIAAIGWTDETPLLPAPEA